MVFVTHDVDEALILADRILVMNGGRIVDDLAVAAPRPRTTDTLLEADMVRHKHVLLTPPRSRDPLPGGRRAGVARRAMRPWLRRHRVSLLVLLAMAAIWQILSMVFTAEAVPGEPMVPGWQIVFSRTLLSLADYWQGGLGVPSVASGAERSYPAALLSILSHSLDTWSASTPGC